MKTQNNFGAQDLEELTRYLAEELLSGEAEAPELFDEWGFVSNDGLLLHFLLKQLSDGRINEAENLLHERIGEDPRPEYLCVALHFYARLSAMNDEYLLARSFSREEIVEGLFAILKYYKTPEPMDIAG